jgi:hypothetical protein
MSEKPEVEKPNEISKLLDSSLETLTEESEKSTARESTQDGSKKDFHMRLRKITTPGQIVKLKPQNNT